MIKIASILLILICFTTVFSRKMKSIVQAIMEDIEAVNYGEQHLKLDYLDAVFTGITTMPMYADYLGPTENSAVIKDFTVSFFMKTVIEVSGYGTKFKIEEDQFMFEVKYDELKFQKHEYDVTMEISKGKVHLPGIPDAFGVKLFAKLMEGDKMTSFVLNLFEEALRKIVKEITVNENDLEYDLGQVMEMMVKTGKRYPKQSLSAGVLDWYYMELPLYVIKESTERRIEAEKVVSKYYFSIVDKDNKTLEGSGFLEIGELSYGKYSNHFMNLKMNSTITAVNEYLPLTFERDFDLAKEEYYSRSR